MNKKASATASASSRLLRNEPEARLAAGQTALTKYFLGSAATAEKFWKTNNPCRGDKSPVSLVKAGKLKSVEQYPCSMCRTAEKRRYIIQPPLG